jgi:hypothetical protein
LVLDGLGNGMVLFQGIKQGKQFIDFGNNAVPPIKRTSFYRNEIASPAGAGSQ